MDLAKDFEDEQPSIVDKVVDARREEEIDAQHHLAVAQLALGAIKVEVDVETFDEFGDGIAIVVRLVLNQAHQLLHVDATLLVRDDRRRQVAQNVRARRLDGVQVRIVLRLLVAEALVVEEELHQQIATVLHVEEDEQAPVDQPGALLQRLNRRQASVLDETLEEVELVQRLLPLLRQDETSQQAPVHVQIVLVVLVDQMLVQRQQLRRLLVAGDVVLKASIVVQVFRLLG